ncbi:Dabb family protein [Cellulophaga baltica]|uniref:Dabb family protein n=1 Tax=Cellulophaga baltica TaxID=76594 RepID=UPI0003FB62C6|nr:Dabb family protein [Cellulophaga baltica]
MKTISLALSLLAFITISAQEKTATKEKMTHTTSLNSTKLLRHVVLFKFKEETSNDDITKIEAAFQELPKKIKEIFGYEWGLNNSPENLNKGFTHCFFLTFKSEADREKYLPHADHKAFGALLTPHLEDVLVVDYWTN